MEAPAGFTALARGESPAGTTGRTSPITSGEVNISPIHGHPGPPCNSDMSIGRCRFCSGQKHPPQGSRQPARLQPVRNPTEVHQQAVQAQLETSPVVFQHHHEDTPVQECPQPWSPLSTLSKPWRGPAEPPPPPPPDSSIA